MFKVKKMNPNHRLIGAILFTCPVIINSLPVYYEGVREIRNDPVVGIRGTIRRAGFYSLVFGYAWIYVVGRGSIPLLGIKLL